MSAFGVKADIGQRRVNVMPRAGKSWSGGSTALAEPSLGFFVSTPTHATSLGWQAIPMFEQLKFSPD